MRSFKGFINFALILIVSSIIVFSLSSISNAILPKGSTASIYNVIGYISPDFDVSGDLALNSGFKIEFKDSGLFTTSDNNGYFRINNTSTNLEQTIIISKSGYLTREIHNIKANCNVQISIKSSPVLMCAGDIMVNGIQDNVINMYDVVQLAKVFNTVRGNAEYNENCDINSDGAINMSDVMIIAKNFNKTPNDYGEIILPYTPTSTNTSTPTVTPTIKVTQTQTIKATSTSTSTSTSTHTYSPTPTQTPTVTPTGGEVRIDFTTVGDTTNMQCNFSGNATAVWHWSDGTTSTAISGQVITKTGLGIGNHENYLTISNGAALTRFGAGNAGYGHLVSINGLQGCPNMAILYAYLESSLTTIGDTSATQIREYHLAGTSISPTEFDRVFRNAVISGVQNGVLWGNNSGTYLSYADKSTLVARGWDLSIPAWTNDTPTPTSTPLPSTGIVRIDFTTTGDSTNMRVDFSGNAAEWHWSDGTTSVAVSGQAITKTGLGSGNHENYLTISNGYALTRFGAGNAGYGHIVSINGLQSCPNMAILYAYLESSLTTIGDTSNTQIREYHLAGTAISSTEFDRVFRNAALSEVQNGTLWGNNSGTNASNADKSTLVARGWDLSIPAWTNNTPAPTSTPLPSTDIVRIDFTTVGDSTNMSSNFSGDATAVWHWSDGTTSVAVSGQAITKTGLGAGNHENYFTISNGYALTRFGAGNAGYGHLVSINGLQSCPNMAILYAYLESSLTTIGDTSNTQIREYHLAATAISSTEFDRVFANTVLSGVRNGVLWGNNSGTSSSNEDKATLVARGWELSIPSWTQPTPIPNAMNVSAKNNPTGFDDTIKVTDVRSGYTVGVFLSEDNTVPAYSAVVPDGQSSVTISVPQLGVSAGSIWVADLAPGTSYNRKVRVDYQQEVQLPVTTGAISFITEGSTFSPVIQVTGNAQVTWTFADGTTSSSNAPIKNYGTPGARGASLVVTPWSAVSRINIGYDAGDGGTDSIEYVSDQQVSSVYNLSLVAPYLRQWCSSYNQISSLDFTNFVQLDTIECFLSRTLQDVNLINTPKLKRICFEDCDLLTFDLTQCPLMEDLRGAVNQYSTINFGTVGANTWHICVRDNPQITNQSLFQDMSQFPNIAELFIWNDNQTGTIRIPSSSKNSNIGFAASGNRYTELNLQGALQNASSSAVVDFSNNELTNVVLTGCTQITNLNLRNNQLSSSEADEILAVLDSLGRSRNNSWAELYVDISGVGNQQPSQAGYDFALNLSKKGWTVIANGWTMLPFNPTETGEARIDFTTNGDSTTMRCDFSVPATATWHWSDGTTSTAVTNTPITKSGLGEGNHQNYLTISNGSSLTRFGTGDLNNGHLVSISGLQNCPNLRIIYVYLESSLTSIGDTSTSNTSEYHLIGTQLSAAEMDRVFSDAASGDVQNGVIYSNNGGTSSSDGDKSILRSRGWTIY